jgi:ATP-binding cassette subfamily F protein 3
MLHINDLTYRIQGRPLLERATLAVSQGERVGLVGRNGAGKTTLFRLIAGKLQADEGDISLQRGARVGWLTQEAPGGPESLIDTVLATDRERLTLLAELEAGADPLRIDDIHTRLAAIEADSAPARAARILAGLGFDEAQQRRPCAEFSGGWRMRVALAALLFSRPDLLLLDEPSNHLDLEATLWLEGYLKSYPGTFILISHERGLLDSSVGRIVHLSERKLTSYRGNYERFERTRREQQRRQAALYARQQAERRHIQAFVDRFRYKASKARQAQSRLKALERMEPLTGVSEEASVFFQFPDPKALAPPILTMEDIAVGYDAGPPVLSDLNLRIDMDDRIALLGANGNGKSTLARLIAGHLQPVHGRLTRGGKLRIGYFSQDQGESLDPEATPLLHLERLMPDETETKLRAQLGRFGFGKDRAEVAVAKLSGGEKARLLFALVSRAAPHLLLLDEPTNHLDMESRQALIEALGTYQGAVILVSHDPHLVQLVADRLWLVADGTVRPYDGDMESYRRLLADRRRGAASDAGPRASNRKPESNKKQQRQDKARRRQETTSLRQAERQAEQTVERLTAELAALEGKLADPAVYDEAPQVLADLRLRHTTLKTELAKAEERWLRAHDEVEAALARTPS